MKQSGGQYILNYLKKEKVPYMIGIPGHGVLGLFDALREKDTEGSIRYLQVKHEQAATHMADGYYRMTGKPLAVFSSIGPGSINTAIGLATAYVDSSAMIAFCGDTHTNMKGVGVLQEIERYQDSRFLSILEPVTKRAWRAESAEQLPRILSRSFAQMQSGRPGPVVVSLPMDVQSATLDAPLPEKPAELPDDRASASEEAVARAVALMKSAKRPVLLLGGGALKSRAANEMVALAEKWGAAVITTLAGKSAFPEDHPLYGYHTGSKGTPVGLSLCTEADVILALGVRFADETCCSYRKGSAFSFPDTKLIHVDRCAEEIGKNYRADVAIIGDLKTVAKQLTEAYDGQNDRPAYRKHILKLKKDWQKLLDERRSAPTENCTISQLIGVMQDTLPDDTVIVSSSGNTQAQLFQEYCFKTPYANLTTGGFSTMGWAVPAAAGAKLACPDRPVVALVGDGDFMMTMQEMSTLMQYNIPVVIILADNKGWFAIKDLQNDAYGEEHRFGNDFMKGEEVYSPDFAKAAEAFGMDAVRISRKEEVADAIRHALACGKPALIHVDVCRDYPYTGGEAYGWWDVPVPAYIEDKKEKFEEGKAEETWTL